MLVRNMYQFQLQIPLKFRNIFFFQRLIFLMNPQKCLKPQMLMLFLFDQRDCTFHQWET